MNRHRFVSMNHGFVHSHACDMEFSGRLVGRLVGRAHGFARRELEPAARSARRLVDGGGGLPERRQRDPVRRVLEAGHCERRQSAREAGRRRARRGEKRVLEGCWSRAARARRSDGALGGRSPRGRGAARAHRPEGKKTRASGRRAHRPRRGQSRKPRGSLRWAKNGRRRSGRGARGRSW